MPRLSLALAATATTLVLAAPAGATPAPVAAPACHRTAAQPRVVATRTSDAAGRAKIVACDRARGRLVTLRRGLADQLAPQRLPVLSVPAVQGTKVVWSELTGSAEHIRQDLRSADVRHPTRQARRRVGPKAGTRPDASPVTPQVLALPGGALAYTSVGEDDATLILERPGHAPRTLTTNDRAISVEDGRTLVWRDDRSFHSEDLRPVPRDASGCPVRSRYRTVVLDTATLRVTSAGYDDGGDPDAPTAFRVCWKASGQDAIVYTTDQESLLTARITQAGPYVALPIQDWDKYQQCQSFPDAGTFHVVVADALTGATAQSQPECVALWSVTLSPTGAATLTVSDAAGNQRAETVPAPTP